MFPAPVNEEEVLFVCLEGRRNLFLFPSVLEQIPKDDRTAVHLLQSRTDDDDEIADIEGGVEGADQQGTIWNCLELMEQ